MLAPQLPPLGRLPGDIVIEREQAVLLPDCYSHRDQRGVEPGVLGDPKPGAVIWAGLSRQASELLRLIL